MSPALSQREQRVARTSDIPRPATNSAAEQLLAKALTSITSDSVEDTQKSALPPPTVKAPSCKCILRSISTDQPHITDDLFVYRCIVAYTAEASLPTKFSSLMRQPFEIRNSAALSRVVTATAVSPTKPMYAIDRFSNAMSLVTTCIVKGAVELEGVGWLTVEVVMLVLCE